MADHVVSATTEVVDRQVLGDKPVADVHDDFLRRTTDPRVRGSVNEPPRTLDQSVLYMSKDDGKETIS